MVGDTRGLAGAARWREESLALPQICLAGDIAWVGNDSSTVL